MTATDIIIKTFPVGPLQCNCTVIGDPATGEAIVADPGGDAELILQTLTELGLKKVTRIIHTHAHFDHFLASGHMREKTGAPLALHKEDRFLWDHLPEQCARFAIPFEPVPPPDQYLDHEEEIPIAHHKGICLHTPGHTPGSMSFWFADQKFLIAGDTLFNGSIGRTDLWGGDYEQIERSIRERLYTLDEEATVVTGHGPSTTIGKEMRTNAYVQAV
jgi:hydroxyacylglutathione hydrolase